MEPKKNKALSLDLTGFNHIAYTEWGDKRASKVAFCVHGLTRNSRDFDFFAESLANAGWRVVCPDLPGRGDSGWLSEASAYNLPNYVNHMGALVARINPLRGVYWVGTSLGGIIGMMMASYPHSPVKKLILNDIGPYIPAGGMQRIAGYVGLDVRFDNIDEVCRHIKKNHPGLGPLEEEQWMHLAKHGSRPAEVGKLRLHYDPKIAHSFQGDKTGATDLWTLWPLVNCPVLAIRGGRSDVLNAETIKRMQETGPKAELLEFADAGHAPLLMKQEQVEPVLNWLEK